MSISSTDIVRRACRNDRDNFALGLLVARMRSEERRQLLPVPGGKQTVPQLTATADFVKVFGCRPLTNEVACSGGRRTKTSKGGNRAKGERGSGACAMGI